MLTDTGSAKGKITLSVIFIIILNIVIDIDFIKYTILATGNNSRKCESTGLKFLLLEYFYITLIIFILKKYTKWFILVRIFWTSFGSKILVCLGTSKVWQYLEFVIDIINI